MSRDTCRMDVDGLAAVPLLRTLPRAPLEALAGQLPSRGVPAGQVSPAPVIRRRTW